MKRFWDKVSKTKRCWEWVGCKDKFGYGRFQYERKVYISHRFAWYLTYGKLPERLLLHHCDNPSCVNPDHLYEGTQKDNMQDVVERKRRNYLGITGEKNKNHKLTEEQILEIRRKYKEYEYGFVRLGREYNVSAETISLIIHKKVWKYL